MGRRIATQLPDRLYWHHHMDSLVRVMGMGGGDVLHVVNDANMTLYNITHPNHFFADGYVSRSVDVKMVLFL